MLKKIKENNSSNKSIWNKYKMNSIFFKQIKQTEKTLKRIPRQKFQLKGPEVEIFVKANVINTILYLKELKIRLNHLI